MIVVIEVNMKAFGYLVEHKQHALNPNFVNFVLHCKNVRSLTITKKTILGICTPNLRSIKKGLQWKEVHS